MATRKTRAAKTPARKTAQAKPASRPRPAATAPVAAKPAHVSKPVSKPVAKAVAKLVAKPVAEPAVKPVAKAVAKVAKPRKIAKPAAPKKVPKLRLKPVRDSFTMPEADFALIATLKARALAAKRETKKSELLRAGLHALALLDAPALMVALGQLAPVKIGRPKAGH